MPGTGEIPCYPSPRGAPTTHSMGTPAYRADLGEQELRQYSELVKRARRRLLQMHHEARVGHLGGNLSALDAMLYLHHHVLGPDDEFVLSKGHSAGALYVTLWSLGELTDEQLKEFHGDGTMLSGHPAPNWHPRIPFATGSLGHGLALSVGMALARRFRGSLGRIYCLMSDGEWQEGSNWEALIFARHWDVGGLTILVDDNGLQGFGTTEDVASMQDLSPRFESFGIPVIEADGHDPSAIGAALAEAGGKLAVILLKTIKGRGVAPLAGSVDSHYVPIDETQFVEACADLDGA
jgi:transketolase